MRRLGFFSILLVGSTVAASAQENGLSKFDQAIDDYVMCTLASLDEIRADNLERDLDFDITASIDQSISNCKSKGNLAAKILMKKYAKNIEFKHRGKASYVTDYALPIVEDDVRNFLTNIVDGERKND